MTCQLRWPSGTSPPSATWRGREKPPSLRADRGEGGLLFESATLRGYYLRCFALRSGKQDIDHGRGQIHCLLQVLSGLKDLIHQVRDVDGHRPGD
ncbi:MAG: hypothetical protein H8D43_04085 [Chloroflexi bacterium]|nr:hypothetical protein [Chloroflexota bacterium]